MGYRTLLVVVALAIGASAAAAQKKGATGGTPGKHSIQGTVQSLSASSFTIKAKDGAEMTFAVDVSTHVTAKGASGKTAAKGGKASFSELVAVGDQVTVRYDNPGGTARAESINVASRGKK
jgi:hypothetical protein